MTDIRWETDSNGNLEIKDDDGNVIMRLNQDETAEILNTLTIGDQSADPTANGEVARNGSDIKFYSGGSVRNASNIGSGGGGGGLWTEDGNSPVNHSGSSSFTYTLASNWDEVLVRLTDTSYDGGSNEQLTMTVNGDTSANYDFVTFDGSTRTGDTKFDVTMLADNLQVITGPIYLSGRWNDVSAYRFLGGGGVMTGQANMGRNTSVTSPLNSFTMSSEGTNFAMDVEVYGRDGG